VAASEAAALAQRSSAFQRDMPRPLVVNREVPPPPSRKGASEASSAALAQAAALIAAEATKMLEVDNSLDPPKGAPAAPEGAKKKKALKPIDIELLAQADEMLQHELSRLAAPMAAELEGRYPEVWASEDADFVYVPSLQKYAAASSVAPADLIAASEQQLHLYKNLLTRDGKKAAKLEKKLELLLGGYRKRTSSLVTRCQSARQAISEKQIELGCFEKLAGQEGLARLQRLGAMEAFVKEQREREAGLQARYAELARLKLTLQEELR
jgi:pre-mRNA-splicing factor CDC5/CEF1